MSMVKAKDKVEIARKVENYEDGPGLVDTMEQHLGKKAMVMRVNKDGKTVVLDIDNGFYHWDIRWLKKVK